MIEALVLAAAAGPSGDNGRTVIIVALIAALPIAYTAYSARKTQGKAAVLDERKVDAESFDRARKADSDTIARLEADMKREREDRQRDLRRIQEAGDKSDRHILNLRQDLSGEQAENRRLREHIERMEETISRLRLRLVTAGLLDERAPKSPPDTAPQASQ